MTTYRTAGTGTPQDLGLLEYGSLTETVRGFFEFAESTGLKPEQVFSSYAVATPIPFYEPDRRARWLGVNPAMMWHPLFWLPERLSRRIEFGNTVEPALPWAIRVCLELSAAGLYATGQGWLDILVDSGIDATTPEGQQRILAWQHGGDDVVLDAVDLSALLSNQDGDPNWAEQASDAIGETVIGAANSLAASELLDAFEEALGYSEPRPFFAAASTGTSLAFASLVKLGDEDAYPGDRAPEEFWTLISSRLSDLDAFDDVEGAKAGPVPEAIRWLEHVRDYYLPQVGMLLGEEEYNEPQPRRAIG